MIIKYASRTTEATADGVTERLVWQGTKAEIDAKFAELSINTFYSGHGYLRTMTRSQGTGTQWELSLQYGRDFGGTGAGAIETPNAAFGEKSAVLHGNLLQMPLEKCPAYRTNWQYPLWRKDGTGGIPNGYDTAITREVTGSIVGECKWGQPGTPPPKGWHVERDATKPGVQSWEIAVYTVTEKAKFRTASAAGNMVKGKLNKIGAPSEDFGLGGSWKCDDATVEWTGKYWIATLTWTRSPDAWDPEMYGTGGTPGHGGIGGDGSSTGGSSSSSSSLSESGSSSESESSLSSESGSSSESESSLSSESGSESESSLSSESGSESESSLSSESGSPGPSSSGSSLAPPPSSSGSSGTPPSSSGSSVAPPPSSSGSSAYLFNKRYNTIYERTEYGYTYYHTPDTHSGEALTTDPYLLHDLAGYDLIEYIPVFDPDTGDYIDDEEVVIGHEQMLVIAGPWDNDVEAWAWWEEHKGEYGL